MKSETGQKILKRVWIYHNLNERVTKAMSVIGDWWEDPHHHEIRIPLGDATESQVRRCLVKATPFFHHIIGKLKKVTEQGHTYTVRELSTRDQEWIDEIRFVIEQEMLRGM